MSDFTGLDAFDNIVDRLIENAAALAAERETRHEAQHQTRQLQAELDRLTKINARLDKENERLRGQITTEGVATPPAAGEDIPF